MAQPVINPVENDTAQEADNWSWIAAARAFVDREVTETDRELAFIGLNGFTETELVIEGGEIVEQTTNLPQDLGSWLDQGPHPIGPFVKNPPREVETKFFDWRSTRNLLEEALLSSGKFIPRPLTLAEAQQELDEGKNFIVRFEMEYPQASGGHVVVVNGYDGNTFFVLDPWPANGFPLVGAGTAASRFEVPFESLMQDQPGSNYFEIAYGEAIPYQWTESLLTPESLDLAFVIDSTGSMGGEIANVQDAAEVLLQSFALVFSDLRIAVTHYQDFPEGSFGGEDDQVLIVETDFTTDRVAAVDAIRAIELGFGGTAREAVLPALQLVAEGAAGQFRGGNTVTRTIILIGDQPGRDTDDPSTAEEGADAEDDPDQDGFAEGDISFTEAIDSLTTPDGAIAVQAIAVASDAAELQFERIATATGGDNFFLEDDGDVSGIIEIILEDLSQDINVEGVTRAPQFVTLDFMPTFEFNPVALPIAAAPTITSRDLEIQVLVMAEPDDPGAGEGEGAEAGLEWVPFRKYSLPEKGLDVAEFMARHEFTKGDYRWRMTGTASEGSYPLPNGAIRSVRQTSPWAETEFLTFSRDENLPGDIVRVAPETTFIAPGGPQELMFELDDNTETYAILIRDWDAGSDRVIHVRASDFADQAPGTVASITVNLREGHLISWAAQGLNLDRQEIDVAAWR